MSIPINYLLIILACDAVVWPATSIIMWTSNKEHACVFDMKDESYSNAYGLHFLWS
jgi:hypothetical protein